MLASRGVCAEKCHSLAPTPCRFCFEVATPESTFYMYAETEKEKDEWIGAIGRAIVRFSSAFTADDGFDDN